MSEHRIAMVGTPCEIMAASKLQYYTESPIDVKLGLFCMENFSYKYFVNLLKEYDLKMDDIEKFQIEKGFVFLLLKTKETVKIPLSVAKRIIRKNCNICVELTSETSDISIGSIGSEEGWSTLIIRTEKGEEIAPSRGSAHCPRKSSHSPSARSCRSSPARSGCSSSHSC